MKFIRTNWYIISVIGIILLAVFLRFYNLENRWGLASDQARDVLVAGYSLKEFKLPLIGPFSSAGQFVYGPQWFWLLSLMILIYPFAVITPWIIQGIFYVGTVFIMILVGKELKNKTLGLLVGLFTAISTAQMAQSVNLTSPSMVGVVSALAVYMFIRYIKYAHYRDGFFLGFLVSTAVNIHFQAIGLFVLLPVAFIFSQRRIKNLGFIIFGAFIPFIPLIYFDLTHNFFESRNFLDYYLHGQYNIYVPNRWLTYIGVFWPKLWAGVIGGDKLIGYGIIGAVSIVTIMCVIKRQISKTMMAIIVSFITMVTILRYYRGERFDAYFVFLHPFILILTAWVIYNLIKYQKIIGILVILVLIISTMRVNIKDITNAKNNTAIQVTEWKKLLIEKYPQQEFAIYAFQYRDPAQSLSLTLYLDRAGKIDDNGYKIGIGLPSEEAKRYHVHINENKLGYELWDLQSSSSALLKKSGWGLVSPRTVYQSTVEWYKK